MKAPGEPPNELSEAAWQVRDRARILGNTAVGCSILDDSDRIFVGCNVEHRFRSHDIHAEIAALSSMVAGGGGHPRVVFIAARRERFTPCGACLDWIFELGGEECAIFIQGDPGGPTSRYLAQELMPHYPR